MKKFLFVLLGVVLVSVPTAARLSLPATDDFERTPSTCATGLGGNWTSAGAATAFNLTNIFGDVSASPCNVFADAFAYWNADVFNDDQYSQAGQITKTHGVVGPAVRVTATGGYYYSCSDGKFWKQVSTTDTAIDPTVFTLCTAGDTVKLTIIGWALEAFINGSSVGTVTDGGHTFASGSAGIWGYIDTANGIGSWEGGNTGGGGPVFPAAIINSPIICCRLDQVVRLLGAK